MARLLACSPSALEHPRATFALNPPRLEIALVADLHPVRDCPAVVGSLTSSRSMLVLYAPGSDPKAPTAEPQNSCRRAQIARWYECCRTSRRAKGVSQ